MRPRHIEEIWRRPRGRPNPLGRDPGEEPSRPKTAEVFRNAHQELGWGQHRKAIELAREVEERTVRTTEKADALRLRALAHAAGGDWLDAMDATKAALALEPEGDSPEVKSSELPTLIEYWRELVIARAERRSPPYGGLIS
jgi:hypothetical protein